MSKYSGGYILHQADFVRGSAHTSGLADPISDLDLETTNALQAVPYEINRWLLNVAGRLWATTTDRTILPARSVAPATSRLPDDEWAKMTPEHRKKYREARRRAWDEAASDTGRRISVLASLDQARALVSERLWFPVTLDFRHRRYPVAASGVSPQGDDLQKALLCFANGKPLGSAGAEWLMIRAATTFGHDKLSFSERAEWALENKDMLRKCARDPLGFREWMKAEEPWQFLATCHELDGYWMVGGSFVSYLPVHLDGSCNGLQHLSAMGRDPEGALATNLVSSAKRQDVYERVAQLVAERVALDASEANEVAMKWHGRVTRKLVKRAVLTTPYGVTDKGIGAQLRDDHGMSAEEARYFQPVLVDAIGKVVIAARQIMAWLQTVAFRFAAAGLGISWTTPTGSTVYQAYRELPATRVETLAGRFTLLSETGTAPVIPRKQALAIAPNLVHSFDAAHLSLTIKSLVDQGITDFSTVHDSYAVHAADARALSVTLRETFAAIYSEDHLGRLAREWRSQAPHVEMPEPPKGLGWDVRQVLDSPFAFS